LRLARWVFRVERALASCFVEIRSWMLASRISKERSGSVDRACRGWREERWVLAAWRLELAG